MNSDCKTPYKCRYPTEVDIEKTEALIQENYPGLRLAPGYLDSVTNEWMYTIWFEQEKDYTWFTMKVVK
jgi:hypothetical protein